MGRPRSVSVERNMHPRGGTKRSAHGRFRGSFAISSASVQQVLSVGGNENIEGSVDQGVERYGALAASVAPEALQLIMRSVGALAHFTAR